MNCCICQLLCNFARMLSTSHRGTDIEYDGNVNRQLPMMYKQRYSLRRVPVVQQFQIAELEIIDSAPCTISRAKRECYLIRPGFQYIGLLCLRPARRGYKPKAHQRLPVSKAKHIEAWTLHITVRKHSRLCRRD